MPFQQPDIPGPHIDGQETWWWCGKDKPDPAPRPPEIILRSVAPTMFQLVQPFAYKDPTSSTVYQISAHDLAAKADGDNTTDFASVPSLFWWLIASYGHQTRAALVHDQLWDEPNADRITANRIFREALRESGVALLRRWIMWAGVDAARRWYAPSLPKKCSVVLQILATVAFFGALCWWAFGSGRLATWWLPALIAVVSTAMWRRAWLSGALGLSLALPALIPELIARFVLYLLEWPFYWAAPGARPSPKPTLKPTRSSRIGL
jgi:Protein of unknown function (DUF1353)